MNVHFKGGMKIVDVRPVELSKIDIVVDESIADVFTQGGTSKDDDFHRLEHIETLCILAP